MAKTYQEINEKIRRGEAVVVTAEEVIDLVRSKGTRKVAQEVDVVTTATFGPMCSSGAFLNIGHSQPRIKIQKAWLNGVNAYAGLAAVDLYIGATEIPDDDPANKIFPGEFPYGGGHVIQDLVAGKDVELEATAYGTHCYPRKRLHTWIHIKDLNEAFLFNPRNAYQNYNVAVNLSSQTRYTYLGVLKPELGNANYCSAGQLSPLLKDPFYRTLGIGTRIFLGGGIGYVVWNGTQHNPTALRGENGVPRRGAGTLSVLGDMKQMNPRWLVGVSFYGYGVSLMVGIGVPIPILNEEILSYAAIPDEELWAPVVDYSEAYPQNKPEVLGEVNYRQLKSGKVIIQGKEVPSAPLSSYSRAVEIAQILKGWIRGGKFLLGEPSQTLPSVDSGISFRPLKERPIQDR
ncbi:MAG: homocysteine biosynthesis protein [candidate division NC10 bacterium]|nr:homocysteine biosynthesis protein [candidate division NC10 bacterium]